MTEQQLCEKSGLLFLNGNKTNDLILNLTPENVTQQAERVAEHMPQADFTF